MSSNNSTRNCKPYIKSGVSKKGYFNNERVTTEGAAADHWPSKVTFFSHNVYFLVHLFTKTLT